MQTDYKCKKKLTESSGISYWAGHCSFWNVAFGLDYFQQWIIMYLVLYEYLEWKLRFSFNIYRSLCNTCKIYFSNILLKKVFPEKRHLNVLHTSCHPHHIHQRIIVRISNKNVRLWLCVLGVVLLIYLISCQWRWFYFQCICGIRFVIIILFF